MSRKRNAQVVVVVALGALLASCRPVSPPIHDAVTKAELAYAMTVARQNFDGSFAHVDAVEMELHGPALEYVDGAGTNTEVGVSEQTNVTILFTKQSGSGWFCVAANGDSTTYGSGASFADVNTVAECSNASW